MASSDLIPILKSLDDTYLDEAQRQRYTALRAAFATKYGNDPQFIARSPGRVNLIGEHIDYEGYAVFPMAIRQDTAVAIRKSGNELIVANLKDQIYPTEVLELNPKQEVDVTSHKWTNYFLAAYKVLPVLSCPGLVWFVSLFMQGVYDYIETRGIPYESPPIGLQILVDGEVPIGSGLSSSSSLVCSCALALLSVLGVLHLINKSEIAEFTCFCERYSGTESGGMDQAISIMAKRGLAKLIEFNPVRGFDVMLPVKGIFVVANSLTVSNKAQTASERYNLRVVECRLAAMLLAKFLQLPKLEIEKIRTLKEVQELDQLGGKSVTELVEESLKSEGYTLPEVQELLGLSVKSAFSDSPNGVRVLESSNERTYELKKRALHVFQEASRVSQMKLICEDLTLSEDEKLTLMGKLMNESHKSCRDFYDCSCAELEELVSVCNSFGAIGSRLTGAGWGGCVVALVSENQQNLFIQNVKDVFYGKRIQNQIITEADLDTCIFATKPSAGGAVFDLREGH
eukprot:g2824.t1